MESFLALLLASGVANKEGVKIVDFGSGYGNLTLPLAHLFPHAKFVAVDFKDEDITLLQERVKAAGLTNVEAICGTVEEVRMPATLGPNRTHKYVFRYASVLELRGASTWCILMQLSTTMQTI